MEAPGHQKSGYQILWTRLGLTTGRKEEVLITMWDGSLGLFLGSPEVGEPLGVTSTPRGNASRMAVRRASARGR